MRFNSHTAAAILAFALVQAGAVPSSQESEAVSTNAPVPPPEEPVYYREEPEDAGIQRRDDKSDKKFDKPARPFGGHYWKGLGDQTNHGPMPDDDSIDLTPYFDHPDPTVRAIASVVKRAADPGMTKNQQGITVIQAPKVHWWEQDGSPGGGGIDPQVGGNPNTVNYFNTKEQGRWGKGMKAREADPDADPDQHGPPGTQGGKWGGDQGGQGMGGGQGLPQGGQPGGMGGRQGEGQGNGQGGPPGGMGGGWGGHGDGDHDPMAGGH